MITYFKNITIELLVIYILKIHVEFHANQILFTTQSINFFLCIILNYKNSKFKHLINDVVINL